MSEIAFLFDADMVSLSSWRSLVPLWICATLAGASMLLSISPFGSWTILGHGTSRACCRVALRWHHTCASILALEDLLRRLCIAVVLVVWPLGS